MHARRHGCRGPGEGALGPRCRLAVRTAARPTSAARCGCRPATRLSGMRVRRSARVHAERITRDLQGGAGWPPAAALWPGDEYAAIIAETWRPAVMAVSARRLAAGRRPFWRAAGYEPPRRSCCFRDPAGPWCPPQVILVCRLPGGSDHMPGRHSVPAHTRAAVEERGRATTSPDGSPTSWPASPPARAARTR